LLLNHIEPFKVLFGRFMTYLGRFMQPMVPLRESVVEKAINM
jgi:hypothetical protein